MNDITEDMINHPEKYIPEGIYCYTPLDIHKREGDGDPVMRIKICPFWESKEEYPSQMNGYCHYLKEGDWETGGLLWDQVKECGINDEEMLD